MAENKDNTTVQTQDINLDELLGTPGAENIMVPTEEKPNLFSRAPKVDIDKLLEKTDDDKANSEGEGKTDAAKTAASTETAPEDKEEIDSILKAPGSDEAGDSKTEESSKKGGRQGGLAELGAKLIEKGILVPFEGEEDVSKYTLKDWEELFESNEQEKAKKYQQQVSEEFFENLPQELQVAAHYVANGGNDLKSLFKSLAAVEEIRQLDTADEQSQEQIVRSYLHATNFGTADEIEEEIEAWKDRDELQAKANKFKPKLDAMQEQIVARQLQQQEQKRKQQEQQAAIYTENIYKILEPGELNGIKLDKKMQNLLFGGLTQANYPSISGRPTNLLGHLLEKYQYVEPNHALITEALWLLADPEGYKSKIKSAGGKEQVEKTVRQLKTEQSSRITSGQGQEEDDNASRRKPGSGVQRPSGSFFKRNN
jgi:microsomal dipeptidase-like Zn-dependent dipeptidase